MSGPPKGENEVIGRTTGPRMKPKALGWALAVVSLWVTTPGSGTAQVVQGRLMDAETGEPVSNGTVALRSGLGTVVTRTEADSVGAYSLTAPRPGMYSLMATALGYQPTSTLQFEVGAEGVTPVDVRLEPEPIELDSLNVEAERQRIIPHLEKQGFYKRMDDGFGQFITPQEIEERNPRYFRDLFRDIPGLQIDAGGRVTRWPPRCRGGTPVIWMDGIRLNSTTELGQAFSIGDIEAVEVYIGAARVPLEYGGIDGQCVMLIWTNGGL